MADLYEIRVRGHLSDDWSEWLGGATIGNLPDGEAVLRCEVADQSALHGLLARLRDLNVPIVHVVRVAPQQ